MSGVERAQAPIIQNLMQLYTHDFSEFWGGTARGDLNAQGLFPAYPLDEYWSQEHWAAMLIWCDRALAGFCLVNDRTHTGLSAQDAYTLCSIAADLRVTQMVDGNKGIHCVIAKSRLPTKLRPESR